MPVACCAGRIKLVVPVGFVCLALQGVSEVIKRIAGAARVMS